MRRPDGDGHPPVVLAHVGEGAQAAERGAGEERRREDAEDRHPPVLADVLPYRLFQRMSNA